MNHRLCVMEESITITHSMEEVKEEERISSRKQTNNDPELLLVVFYFYFFFFWLSTPAWEGGSSGIPAGWLKNGLVLMAGWCVVRRTVRSRLSTHLQNKVVLCRWNVRGYKRGEKDDRSDVEKRMGLETSLLLGVFFFLILTFYSSLPFRNVLAGVALLSLAFSRLLYQKDPTKLFDVKQQRCQITPPTERKCHTHTHTHTQEQTYTLTVPRSLFFDS